MCVCVCVGGGGGVHCCIYKFQYIRGEIYDARARGALVVLVSIFICNV